MTKIAVSTSENADGTYTYTVKCGLEEVLDMYGNVVENPIQTLYKDEDGVFVLYNDVDFGNDNDNEIVDPIRSSAGDDIVNPTHNSLNVEVTLAPTTSNNNDNNNQDEDILLARECWCARVFQHGFHKFFSRPMDDDSSILGVTEKPIFCPLDTTADAVVSNQDVRVCTARAVINWQDETLTAKESACYSEVPISEFAKSAWPLCFFWWIILFYILSVTQYGRRVRGYLWRNLCLTTSKLTGREKRQRERRRRNRTSNTDATSNNNGGGDEEAATSSPPPGDDSNTTTNNNNSNSNSTELSQAQEDAIEQEFGSLQNYRLLDRELRYQAEHTENEYVTWLWYSAVYTEVRRYRHQREVERRERARQRRRQDLAGVNQNAFNAENNTSNDNASTDSNSDDGEDLLGTRRLDNLYWWPPSGPDGSRWNHLRANNAANARRPGELLRDQDGNPVDPSRLRLKTKTFTLIESETDLPPKQDKPNVGDDDGDDTTDDNTEACTEGGDTVRIGDGTEAPPTATATSSTADTVQDASSDDLYDDEYPENVCSICLVELEEGDIVGDIPCGHVFHKECLKAWLLKNNHCPICRMPGIASHHPLEAHQIP